jgi:hypothetical protein
LTPNGSLHRRAGGTIGNRQAVLTSEREIAALFQRKEIDFPQGKRWVRSSIFKL